MLSNGFRVLEKALHDKLLKNDLWLSPFWRADEQNHKKDNMCGGILQSYRPLPEKNNSQHSLRLLQSKPAVCISSATTTTSLGDFPAGRHLKNNYIFKCDPSLHQKIYTQHIFFFGNILPPDKKSNFVTSKYPRLRVTATNTNYNSLFPSLR